jgi:O-antigen ligase
MSGVRQWWNALSQAPLLLWAVVYAIVAVPMQDYAMVAGFTHSQLATIALVPALLIHVRWHAQQVLPRDETLWARALMVTAVLISAAFTAYSWRSGIDELRRWGLAMLVGYAVYVLPRNWNDVVLVVTALVLAPLGAAVFALWQSFAGIGPAAFGIPGTSLTRAFGTIGQPNSFAGYLNMAWPLLVGLSIWSWTQRRWWRWWPMLALAMVWLALGLSFSRGGWLGAATGMLVMMWLQAGRWRMLAATIVLTVVVVLVGGWRLIPAPLGPRLGSASQIFTAPALQRDEAQQRPDVYAAVERAAQFGAGWAMWQSAPMTGVGAGNYTAAYGDVAYNGWWISRGHAHNAYMQIAAEQGVIGLLAYLWLGWVQWRRSRRIVRQDGGLHWLGIAACGTLAAVAAHECFEYLQVHYLPLHAAAVVALAGVSERLTQQNGEERV